MTIQLNLEKAFPSEQALRDMIVSRQVCFDHDPFYVKTGAGNVVQIGFQLNLYAAFQDPAHLPVGDDAEHREILGDLQRLCRVFFQSLDLLKPCEHPQPPAHRIVFSPERKHRAEVCLQVPIFDLAHYADTSARHVQELVATAECLLKAVGARRGRWEEGATTEQAGPAGQCEAQAAAAHGHSSPTPSGT